MFTVTHTARDANKIIPKTTQEGIIPPRRRTSVREPMISTEICCTEARELVRGVTRCALILSSTQYVFATLLTSHLPVPLPFRFRLGRTFQLHANVAKVKAYASGACHPYPAEQIVMRSKLRGCLIEFCGFGHKIVGTL
jgi:hypothetical protein